MNLCALCQSEQPEAVMVAVMPATWNGFSNVALVCDACQQSRKFKTWARAAAKGPQARVAVPSAVPDAASQQAASIAHILISHRQTGALLHTVAGATLEGSALRKAVLCNANLRLAEMKGADLRRADLHLADLSGADLRSADLRAVNFRGADLRGADLREARLFSADLRHSLYDDETAWPVGFDILASGAVAAPTGRF